MLAAKLAHCPARRFHATTCRVTRNRQAHDSFCCAGNSIGKLPEAFTDPTCSTAATSASLVVYKSGAPSFRVPRATAKLLPNTGGSVLWQRPL